MAGTEQELAALIPLKRRALQMLRAACALPELLRKQVLELAELRASVARLHARLAACEARAAPGPGANAPLGGEEAGPAGGRARALRALLEARRRERGLLEAELAARGAPGTPGGRQPGPAEPGAPAAPSRAAEPAEPDALDVFRDLF